MDPLNRLRRRMSKLTPTYLDEQPEPTYEEVCREMYDALPIAASSVMRLHNSALLSTNNNLPSCAFPSASGNGYTDTS